MTNDTDTKTVDHPYDPEKDPKANSGTDQYPRVKRKRKALKIALLTGGCVLFVLVIIIAGLKDEHYFDTMNGAHMNRLLFYGIEIKRLIIETEFYLLVKRYKLAEKNPEWILQGYRRMGQIFWGGIDYVHFETTAYTGYANLAEEIFREGNVYYLGEDKKKEILIILLDAMRKQNLRGFKAIVNAIYEKKSLEEMRALVDLE